MKFNKNKRNDYHFFLYTVKRFGIFRYTLYWLI